jgi:hypothetical protein
MGTGHKVIAMRIQQLALVVIFLALPAIVTANGATQPTAGDGTVYYYGFDIERVTGIPEHQIDQYGYSYTISKEGFVSLLKSANHLSFMYDQRDVRAHVSFGVGEQYFVNRKGIVRYGNQYFVLRKEDFVSLLLPRKRLYSV